MADIVLKDAPELASIEKTKAQKIKETFEPMVELLSSFDERYNAIIATPEESISEEVVANAKRLRLDIAKVRIETDKLRKAEKEEYLRAGKAIDGVSNILKWAVTDKENKLKEIEDYHLIKEKERLEKLQKERVDLLIPYVENAEEIDLAGMQPDVFEAYLQMKQKQHEDRVEAERKAEEERKRKEEEERLERERIAAENERLKKEAAEREEKERIEREKREKEEKERKAREEAEEKLRREKEQKEREEQEAKLRKEREAREAAEAKLKQEQEERDRKVKEEQERRLQEEKIAQAKADKPKKEIIATEILQLRSRLLDRGIEFTSKTKQEWYENLINVELKQLAEEAKK